jgi:PAS domain-containing protein
VVLIRTTGFDILAALSRAARAGRKVGILSYREVSRELEEAQPLFTLDVRQAAYRTLAEARTRVKELAAEGCEVIAGSSMVTELAEEAGLAGVLIVSGSAIRQALDDAMAILRGTHEDAAKRQRLDTILHHLTDGVLAIGPDGKVQSLNPAMAQFLEVIAAMGPGPPHRRGRPIHPAGRGAADAHRRRGADHHPRPSHHRRQHAAALRGRRACRSGAHLPGDGRGATHRSAHPLEHAAEQLHGESIGCRS